MADYYPLIARAVAGLDKNTGENRRALYERARAALVNQLRGVDPPLDEADITRERLGLEEAIRRRYQGPRECNPFGLVCIEQRGIGVAGDDGGQLPRKVDCVADTGVHALAAGRTVNVAGVAAEKRTA